MDQQGSGCRAVRDSQVVSDAAEGRTVLACGGYRFFCRNREEFERICHDVFDGHEYVFDTRHRSPLIIDAGAHVGVAPEAGTIPFFTSETDEEPGAWGDSAIQQPWHEGEATAVVQVPAVTLSSLLTEPVDLLKLDIEGLETAVLEEAAPQLSTVRRVILEFHGTRRNPS